MERLTINIPDAKSNIVKQFLEELGVTIEQEEKIGFSEYRKKLAEMPVWSDDDLKVFEEISKAFGRLKPQQW